MANRTFIIIYNFIIIIYFRSLIAVFFNITYMYYSFFGTLITVFVGTLVGIITQSDDDQYDYKLLHPLVLTFCRLFGYCVEKDKCIAGTADIATISIRK